MACNRLRSADKQSHEIFRHKSKHPVLLHEKSSDIVGSSKYFEFASRTNISEFFKIRSVSCEIQSCRIALLSSCLHSTNQKPTVININNATVKRSTCQISVYSAFWFFIFFSLRLRWKLADAKTQSNQSKDKIDHDLG